MSGQPTNTISDVNRFKNEYLETLNLQADINDLNLQANKNYLKTGSLPPQSQLSDNRTTSEIMADTEKLRTYIISALKPIANAQLSSAIVQGISSHILNSDNSLLRFLAQRVDDIVKEIKKNYKFGIVGDDNDVEVLVSFIANLYSDRKNIFSSTKDFLNSAQGPYGGGKTLSTQDVDSIIRDLTEIQRRSSIGYSKGANDPLFEESQFLFINLFQILKELKNTLPSNEQLKSILDNFDNDLVNVQNGHDLKAVYEIIESLPKISQVNTIFKKIEMNLKNKNPTSVNNLLNVLIDNFSTWLDMDSVRIMREFKENYIAPLNQERENARTINMQQQNFYYNPVPGQSPEQGLEQGPVPVPEQDPYQDNNDDDDDDPFYPYNINPNLYQRELQRPEHINPFIIPPENRYFRQSENPRYQMLENQYRRDNLIDINRILRHSNNQLDYVIPNEYASTYRDIDVYNAGPIQEERLRLENGPIRNSQSRRDNYNQVSNPPQSRQQSQQIINRSSMQTENVPPMTFRDLFFNAPLINQYEVNLRDSIDEMSPDEINELLTSYNIRINRDLYRNKLEVLKYYLTNGRPGSTGSGINKKVGRPRGYGIIKKTQEPTFIGFGISEINQKKLNDGILTIRRNTRTSYADMPSKKISPELQFVVKSMIGGNIPRTNELNRLSEDEINYLNKIVKRSDMDQKMNIPTPSKDKLLKDSDQFEIMKGEILSGNDSKELVKKFKLMILKLSRNGMLPKNESNELLQTLVELGY